jgi:hypothetical protein
MKLESHSRGVKPRGLIPTFAVLVILLAAMGTLLVLSLMGPPKVDSREAYAGMGGEATFDHAAFHAVLQRWVDEDGWVDYGGLAGEPQALGSYITSLATAPFAEMGRDSKLALLINAYNAFTLQLILDYWSDGSLSSIRDIPGPQRWDDKRWTVGGRLYSLNELEHGEIRLNFQEPRIHFALVCAAWSCPPLRNEAYLAHRLEAQLEDQSALVHSHDRWFRFDRDKGVVELTRLYDWYGHDFEQEAGSILDYVARYSPELKEILAAGGSLPHIRWMEYNWHLNSLDNAP